VAHYYYTPFLQTDANERRTWNYYCAKGATFVATAHATGNDNRTPDELARQVIDDGIPNVEANIRLLVCYGDGPSPIDEEFPAWSAVTGGDAFAKTFALELGRLLQQKFRIGASAVLPRVAGYQGPTHTGERAPNEPTGTLVKPLGPKQLKGQKPVEQFVWRDTDPNDAFQQYVEIANAVPKSFIVWYDTRGTVTLKYKLQAATGPAPAGGGPLAMLRTGDTLLIMAHGFMSPADKSAKYVRGGRIGAFAGPNMKKMTSMDVQAAERKAGKRDDRDKTQFTFPAKK
jgi:hypothetical protein